MIRVAAEYGSYGEPQVYWAAEAKESGELRVVVDNAVVWQGTSSHATWKAMARECERLRLFQLPSFRYEADLTDDVYHMGASLSARVGEDTFEHQVPLRQFVCVATIHVAAEERMRFCALALGLARLARQESGVELPEYVRLKWEACRDRIKAELV